ncbi:MAG: vitamin K epoxide reductase family protein [Nitrososphaerota archaeon]
MSKKTAVIYLLSSFLSIAGLITSVYISLARLSPPEFCELGSLFSCEEILFSPYSSFLGISMEYYGAAWFTVSLLLSLSSLLSRMSKILLFGWSVLGILGVACLVYVEVFLVNSICILCTVAHAFGILIFSASYIGYKYSK